MADNLNTPLYPTTENAGVLKDIVNLQSQLNTLLLKQSKLTETIGHSDKSLEANLNARISAQTEFLNKQRNEVVYLDELMKKRIGLHGVDLKQWKIDVKSVKERIANTNKIVEQLEILNELDIQMAKRRYEEDHKWVNFMTSSLKSITGFKNAEYDTVKAIGEQLSKYPLKMGAYAYSIASVVVMLQHAYKLFNDFDKSAAKFRMSMGMTREEASSLRKMTEKIAIDYMHIGVTVDKANTALKALGSYMGGVHAVSEQLVRTTSIFSAQLGISEDVTAGFLKNMAAISGTSMEAQQNTAYIAANMANAAGVPLDSIMKDVSTRSQTTLTMMSRLPNVILRSSIELKRMGTSLSEAAKSSRELLNFTDSVASEMEASVLLGRGINLQRARELAYRRDLEGSTKEILRITKSINFENLDVFQQEAFARATGKSVDELLRMVQTEKQLEAARRDPTLAGKVEAYEKMRNANQQMLKDNASNLELMLMTRSNQEYLTAISQKWNQILAKASVFLLPIVDGILSAVDGFMPLVPLAMAFSTSMTGILGVVGRVVGSIGKIGGLFTYIGGIIANSGLFKIGAMLFDIGIWTSRFFSKFPAFASFASKFIGVFSKVLGPLGIIINAFQFIGVLMKKWQETPKGFLGGLEAIGTALREVFLKPFVDVYNWIVEHLCGKSPSEIGLGIVKGITSVGAALYDALTYPFRQAFAWIMDKIPGMDKFSDRIREGASGFLKRSVENSVGDSYTGNSQVSTSNVSTNNADSKTSKNSTATTSGDSDSDNPVLNDILLAIKTLNNNLENGKIGIYMDGQLLSATLSRQTDFRGGYGVNKV